MTLHPNDYLDYGCWPLMYDTCTVLPVLYQHSKYSFWELTLSRQNNKVVHTLSGCSPLAYKEC